MAIIFPSGTRDIINQIRNVIGRKITIFVSISGIPCTESGCNLNPVTNLSTNQFCLTCGGNYWLNTTSGFEIMAHITHKTDDIPVWVAGGHVVDGDCRVQFEYTPSSIYAVNNSVYYLVDSHEYIQKNISLRGVPKINRVVVTLKQKEG